ncbi:MAG: CvpA family protein [Pseudomonadales bacterium]
MPTPDVVLLIVILLSAVMGLFRGLVKEVLSLAAWLLAFLLAMYLSPRLAENYAGTFGGFTVARVVLFVVIFAVTLIAASMLQWMLGKFLESTGLSDTDRFLGFLFGSVRGVMVCIVALIALRGFAEDSQWWQDSRLIPEFMAFEQDVLSLMGYAKDAVVDLNQELSEQMETLDQ